MREWQIMCSNFVIIVLICSVRLSTTVSSNCSEATKGPIIAALLDLHSDEKCSVVNSKGIQQLAALQETLKKINNEFRETGIEIILQVFDSCSSKKVAVTSTLKALVSSKQTCLHPPLFLGFLGPENSSLLKAVQNLTKIFHTSHVLPYSIQGQERAPDNKALYITNYPTEKYIQAILLLVKKLGWKNISLIFEESDEARIKSEYLVAAIYNNKNLCIDEEIIQIQDKSSLQAALKKRVNSDGIIIILEHVKWSHSFVKYLDDLANQVIVSLSRVGIQSWELSCRNHSIYLLLQISASPIFDLHKMYDAYLMKIKSEQDFEDYRNMCKQEGIHECNNDLVFNSLAREQDWTVNLMQYGLMLFSSGLRVAHYSKCKSQTAMGLCPDLINIPSNEWNSMLSNAKVFIKPAESHTINKKITFQMDVVPRFNVYTTFMMDKLEKVAWIDNDSFFVAPWYKFPTLKVSENASECGYSKLPEPTIHENVPVIIDESGFENFFGFEYGYYETIGIVAGVGFGSLVLMILIIFVVYNSFKVKSSSSPGNSYSENSSRSPRNSIESR